MAKVGFFTNFITIVEASFFKKILATLLLFLLVALPSNIGTYLHGFPLSSGGAVFFLIILISIWATKWVGRWRLYLWAASFLVIVHFIGANFLPIGWNVCVKRDISLGNIETNCEPSSYFRDGSKTYQLEKISFIGKKFPLNFMNELSLNFYEDGQFDRSNLPYNMKISGYLFGDKNNSDFSVLTTIPKTQIRVNDKVYFAKVGSRKTYALNDGMNVVEIGYDTQRKDGDILKITTGRPVFAHSVGRGRAIWLAIYKTMDAIGSFLLFCVFVPEIIKNIVLLSKNKKLFLCLAFFPLLILGNLAEKIVMASLPLVQQSLIFLPSSFIGLTDRIKELLPEILGFAIFPVFFVVVQWLFILQKMEKTIWQYLFILAFAFVFVANFVPPDSVMILHGGDDPLTHESFSRAVLLSTSFKNFLIAGENTFFYYQPLYRYVLAGFHYLFGEALFGPFVVQTMLVCLLLRNTGVFLYFLNKNSARLFFALMLPLLVFNYTSLFGLAISVMQQAVATPLFLLSIVWLLNLWLHKERHFWAFFAAGLIFGISLMVRTDLLPAILGIAILVWYTATTSEGKNKRNVLKMLFVLGILLPVLFVGYRNISVAGRFAVFPQSGGVNLLAPFNNHFHISGPSNIGAAKIYMEIIRIYGQNPAELVVILGRNIIENFIGYDPARILVWLLAPVLIIIILFKKADIFRPILVILLIILPMLLANSFFALHNGWSMLMHFDFLLVLLCALALVPFGNKHDVSVKHFM